MEVHVDELWKYPAGMYVYINEKRYVYLGREEWAHEVYDEELGLIVDLDDMELETVVVVDTKPDVDKLLGIEVARYCSLLKDGWKLNGGRYLDLTPRLEKIRALRELQKVLK